MTTNIIREAACLGMSVDRLRAACAAKQIDLGHISDTELARLVGEAQCRPSTFANILNTVSRIKSDKWLDGIPGLFLNEQATQEVAQEISDGGLGIDSWYNKSEDFGMPVILVFAFGDCKPTVPLGFAIADNPYLVLPYLIKQVCRIVLSTHSLPPTITISPDEQLYNILITLGIPLVISLYAVARQTAIEVEAGDTVPIIVGVIQEAFSKVDDDWAARIRSSRAHVTHPNLCRKMITSLHRGAGSQFWSSRKIPTAGATISQLQWLGDNDRRLLRTCSLVCTSAIPAVLAVGWILGDTANKYSVRKAYEAWAQGDTTSKDCNCDPSKMDCHHRITMRLLEWIPRYNALPVTLTCSGDASPILAREVVVTSAFHVLVDQETTHQSIKDLEPYMEESSPSVRRKREGKARVVHFASDAHHHVDPCNDHESLSVLSRPAETTALAAPRIHQAKEGTNHQQSGVVSSSDTASKSSPDAAIVHLIERIKKLPSISRKASTANPQTAAFYVLRHLTAFTDALCKDLLGQHSSAPGEVCNAILKAAAFGVLAEPGADNDTCDFFQDHDGNNDCLPIIDMLARLALITGLEHYESMVTIEITWQTACSECPRKHIETAEEVTYLDHPLGETWADHVNVGPCGSGAYPTMKRKRTLQTCHGHLTRRLVFTGDAPGFLVVKGPMSIEDVRDYQVRGITTSAVEWIDCAHYTLKGIVTATDTEGTTIHTAFCPRSDGFWIASHGTVGYNSDLCGFKSKYQVLYLVFGRQCPTSNFARVLPDPSLGPDGEELDELPVDATFDRIEQALRRMGHIRMLSQSHHPPELTARLATAWYTEYQQGMQLCMRATLHKLCLDGIQSPYRFIHPGPDLHDTRPYRIDVELLPGHCEWTDPVCHPPKLFAAMRNMYDWAEPIDWSDSLAQQLKGDVCMNFTTFARLVTILGTKKVYGNSHFYEFPMVHTAMLPSDIDSAKIATHTAAQVAEFRRVRKHMVPTERSSYVYGWALMGNHYFAVVMNLLVNEIYILDPVGVSHDFAEKVALLAKHVCCELWEMDCVPWTTQHLDMGIDGQDVSLSGTLVLCALDAHYSGTACGIPMSQQSLGFEGLTPSVQERRCVAQDLAGMLKWQRDIDGLFVDRMVARGGRQGYVPQARGDIIEWTGYETYGQR